jgi:hypothetical protein
LIESARALIENVENIEPLLLVPAIAPALSILSMFASFSAFAIALAVGLRGISRLGLLRLLGWGLDLLRRIGLPAHNGKQLFKLPAIKPDPAAFCAHVDFNAVPLDLLHWGHFFARAGH